jgi:hypothetical protein
MSGVYDKYSAKISVFQSSAAGLSAVDKMIQAEENKKRVLKRLFKSMIYNLMTAKIRVKGLDLNGGYVET